MQEIVAPHVVSMGRSEPDTRAVRQPEPLSPRLTAGDFQPLLPPESLHPLMIDHPSLPSQHGRDPMVAVSAVLAGQLHYPNHQNHQNERQAIFGLLQSLHPLPRFYRCDRKITFEVDPLVEAIESNTPNGKLPLCWRGVLEKEKVCKMGSPEDQDLILGHFGKRAHSIA